MGKMFAFLLRKDMTGYLIKKDLTKLMTDNVIYMLIIITQLKIGKLSKTSYLNNYVSSSEKITSKIERAI